MKKILLSIATLLLIIIVVVFYRTLTVFENNQFQVTNPIPPISINQPEVLNRFSQAIQIPTISYDNSNRFDHQAFQVAFRVHYP